MTRDKITQNTLQRLKTAAEKAVFLTAYDYATATFAAKAGADMLLVGDSAAMTMLGHPTTLGIDMPTMLVFARAVSRGAQHLMVIGDMPFMSYQPSNETAVRNAGAFLSVGGCDAVKCEGGAAIAARVGAVTDAGIGVMGHLGLTPQRHGTFRGFRVQGKTLADAERIAADARALEDAGAFALLLEAVPAETAAFVRDQVAIPVYGIGAGPHVDGQLLIVHDLLGTFVGDIHPRFVKEYAQVGKTIESAIRRYAADVRASRFPAQEHCYPIDPLEEAQLRTRRRSRQPAHSTLESP